MTPSGLSEPENGRRRPGPRSQKGVQTRARLLSAAKAVFERDGFIDARVSDIAEEASVCHGSFYHYFDSKEDIFREVGEAVEEHLSEPMSIILDPQSKAAPAERLSEAIRSHLERYRDEAEIMRVIEQVTRFDEHMKAARAVRLRTYEGQVAGSIRQLQERGLADPGLNPTIAAAALGSMVARFPESWFVEGRINVDFDSGVEQFTRVFVNSLGLRHGSRSRSHR